MKAVPIEQSFNNFQGLYTDIDPDDLPANILSYAVNTKWVNRYTIGKRGGLTKKTWAGTGYLKTAAIPAGLYSATVLDYFAGQKRGGDNIYEVVLLSGRSGYTPTINEGHVYIEITNASTGALVSSNLFRYNQGGTTRNQFPTRGRIVQYLDYILWVDESENKVFYLDLTSSETTTTIAANTINSSDNAGFLDTDAFNDIDVHTNRVFVTGSKGQVNYGAVLSALDFTTASGSGYIQYRATSSLIAKQARTSYLGLVISSDNTALNEVGSDLMTGTTPFVLTEASTQSRGYQVTNLSSDVAFIPGSIQNIDNNIIGLTQTGVVDLGTLVAAFNNTSVAKDGRVVTDEDTLSYPIGDIVRDFNSTSGSVFSAYDPTTKRYFLSVPRTDEVSTTKYVYVYDYQYKSGIPRWSIWKLSINGVKGLFTTKGEAYVSDILGDLYKMDTTNTQDHLTNFYASVELAALGGDTDFYEKSWDGATMTIKAPANATEKDFLCYVIADEYQDAITNFNESKMHYALRCLKKFPLNFSRFFTFLRTRTFGDQGYGSEIYFKKTDIPNSRNVRLVIGDDPEGDNYVPYWELKKAYIKGWITNEAAPN